MTTRLLLVYNYVYDAREAIVLRSFS